MKSHTLAIKRSFELESGETLPELKIQYCTAGEMNEDGSNVVWVFHALTANANPIEWWSGLVGDKKTFSPDQHFIICANVLGSCYGTTGPCAEETPLELKGLNFPKITVRDVTRVHELLADHLAIKRVKYAIGGSFGGYQAFEFALGSVEVENLIVIASAAIEAPWNIAIHQTQRMAITSDATLSYSKGGKKGLETARGIGLLTYRTPASYNTRQPRFKDQTENFDASSYVSYQGKKLSDRFSAHSYLTLIDCLDTHDLGRNRGSLTNALSSISSKSLCIGIKEDLLASSELLAEASKHLTKGCFEEISSDFGHDGFLIEAQKISKIITNHFN